MPVLSTYLDLLKAFTFCLAYTKNTGDSLIIMAVSRADE